MLCQLFMNLKVYTNEQNIQKKKIKQNMGGSVKEIFLKFMHTKI